MIDEPGDGADAIGGPDFTIEERWKELLIYREGDHEHVFGAGWGVDPPSVTVPSEAAWDRVMPEWLRGRRAEIVARLQDPGGHVLYVLPDGD